MAKRLASLLLALSNEDVPMPDHRFLSGSWGSFAARPLQVFGMVLWFFLHVVFWAFMFCMLAVSIGYVKTKIGHREVASSTFASHHGDLKLRCRTISLGQSCKPTARSLEVSTISSGVVDGGFTSAQVVEGSASGLQSLTIHHSGIRALGISRSRMCSREWVQEEEPS